jgi:hypothetical protein
MKGKHTAEIRVYLPNATKQALTKIAQQHGLSLSELLGQAAIGKHLGAAGEQAYLKKIERRLAQIEKHLSMPVVEPKERKKRSARVEHPKILSKSSTPVFDAGAGTLLPIYALIERFGSTDKGLKARLHIVGRPDEKLFRGDRDRAEKVAAMTRKHDPEDLTWLPMDHQRRNWVQMLPEEWVLKVVAE